MSATVPPRDLTFLGDIASRRVTVGILPTYAGFETLATLNSQLFAVLLDSWDRNNTILTNLLGIIPERGLSVRAMEAGPSVAELFMHMHYVRLVFMSEDAPEFARELPEKEWISEPDRGRIAQMLNQSAAAVRDAVKSRVETDQAMNIHYDHPVLLLQHMIWHEGYHYGQIKLALKMSGHAISNEEAGPLSWRVWMNKKPNGSE